MGIPRNANENIELLLCELNGTLVPCGCGLVQLSARPSRRESLGEARHCN